MCRTTAAPQQHSEASPCCARRSQRQPWRLAADALEGHPRCSSESSSCCRTAAPQSHLQNGKQRASNLLSGGSAAPDWSRGHVTAGADVAACCRVASLPAASSQWDGRRGNTKLLTLRPSAKAQPLSIRCPYLSVLRHTQPLYLFYSYYFHFPLDSLCSCCCSYTVYLLGEPAQDWCFRHKWQIKTWKNPLLKPGQGPDLSPAPFVAARTLTLDPDPDPDP